MKKYILMILMTLLSNKIFAQSQISNLVMPVSYFVNHVKQLEILQDNLDKYRQASVVGVSGMGKTQLARMYAYENKDQYDVIWFVDCNLDINQELLKLAKTINSTYKTNLIAENTETIKQEIIDYFTSKNGWLLVFDNLKIGENKKIQDFINWENNGHIIFCSQDSESLPNITKMSSFNKKDSLTLLQNVLKDGNPALIEFLVQEFDGYPVLMVQGAQLLNQVQGLSVEEYKKKIKVSNDKIGLNMKLAISQLKPSAKMLLNEIALINNQNFSKELLSSITNNKDSLDDDIYQLSKFALISTTENDENNPVFEMHDIIAEKVLQINGYKDNKIYLEQVVTNFLNSIPKSVIKGRIFRNSKTISDNIKIVTENAEKYSISIYKILELKLHLIIQAVNSSDLSNSKKLLDWFNENDNKNNFKLLIMNNEEKRAYATYLGLIGWYYRNFADHHEAIKYDLRAKKVFEDVKGYDSLKCNVIFALVISNIQIGNVQEAEKNIDIIEEMFNKNLVDKADQATLHYAKTKLFFIQGKYDEALKQINNTINICIENGMKEQDLFLNNYYIIKAEILNNLKEYKNAYLQAEQVYNINKPYKHEKHQVFGRIFTQMSNAKLGLQKTIEALEYANKAKIIFIDDLIRVNSNITNSSDIELAKAYVAEGDALSALGENEKAIESYATAEIIYYNNYRENMKNVDEISKMYLSAVKAACKLPNKHWYSKFHNQHMEKFGAEHPRSIEILNLKCLN